jgi:hypothetical protein
LDCFSHAIQADDKIKEYWKKRGSLFYEMDKYELSNLDFDEAFKIDDQDIRI